MTKSLAVVGASGHGKVIADIAEQLGYLVCFYDDAFPTKNYLEHWPILGTTEDLIKVRACENVVVAIGDNNIRALKYKSLEQNGFNLISLIHPTAVVSRYASIENGTVILANTVINAFARIGTACIINTSSIIEHDCYLGDFVHISPNAALAGGANVGSNTWIGIGASVKQLVKIGENTIIGAGSIVLNNIADNSTAFGSPCTVRDINTKII